MSPGLHTYWIRCNDSDGYTYSGNLTVQAGGVISYCGNIISPGKYDITSNITTSALCFDILSDNVTIQGNGYTITGGSIGFKVDNVKNITISNITVEGFGVDIYFKESDLYLYDCNIGKIKGGKVTTYTEPYQTLFIKNCNIDEISNYDTSYCFNSVNITILNSYVGTIKAAGDHNFRFMYFLMKDSTLGQIYTSGTGYNFQTCSYGGLSNPMIFDNVTFLNGFSVASHNDFEYECYILFNNSRIYGGFEVLSNAEYVFLRSILEYRNCYINATFDAVAPSAFNPEGYSNRYLVFNNSIINTTGYFLHIVNTHTLYPERGAGLYIIGCTIYAGKIYADTWKYVIKDSEIYSTGPVVFNRGSKNEVTNVTFVSTDMVVFSDFSSSIIRQVEVNCTQSTCLVLNTTSEDDTSIGCEISSNGSIEIVGYPLLINTYMEQCYVCPGQVSAPINIVAGVITWNSDQPICIEVSNVQNSEINIQADYIYSPLSGTFLKVSSFENLTLKIHAIKFGNNVELYDPAGVNVIEVTNGGGIRVLSASTAFSLIFNNSKLDTAFIDASVKTYIDTTLLNTTISGTFKGAGPLTIEDSQISYLTDSGGYAYAGYAMNIINSNIGQIYETNDYGFRDVDIYLISSSVDYIKLGYKTQGMYYGKIIANNSVIERMDLGSQLGALYNAQISIYNSQVSYIFLDYISSGFVSTKIYIENTSFANAGDCIYDEGITSSWTIDVYNSTFECSGTAIRLAGGATAKIIGNKFLGVTTALELYNTKPSTIYNNLFNVTGNYVVISGTVTHSFNTTLKNGTNIVGGPYIGGNYWGRTDLTGFSDICNDTNGDFICDDPFIINDYNIDFLPLKLYIPPTPPAPPMEAGGGGGGGPITPILISFIVKIPIQALGKVVRIWYYIPGVGYETVSSPNVTADFGDVVRGAKLIIEVNGKNKTVDLFDLYKKSGYSKEIYIDVGVNVSAGYKPEQRYIWSKSSILAIFSAILLALLGRIFLF